MSKKINPFYYTAKWRKTSKEFLYLNPNCEWHLFQGVEKPAKVTDHVIPIALGGDKYSHNNLQALCRVCHGIKSASEVVNAAIPVLRSTFDLDLKKIENRNDIE